MVSFKYDIVELLKIETLDALSAVKNFDGWQDYFDKLTDFTQNARNYLRAYTPSVVIYSEEVRQEFGDQLENTRRILMSLGAISATEELKNLDDAICKNDAGILSDRLLKFYAEMDIMAKRITLARVPDADGDSSTASAKTVIFAIDDKPEILTTINNMLGSKYKVIAMTNGKVALKAMEMHSPSLILLDIEMPIISGYELAKEIRANEKLKNTPILFLTGKSSRNAVITAMAHGGNDYLLKPVDKNTLLNKIELHLIRAR